MSRAQIYRKIYGYYLTLIGIEIDMTSQKIKVQTIFFVQNVNQFQKDDTDEDFDFQFDFSFELDFESLVALDHTSQLHKDIRLFEIQNSEKAANKQHSAPPANISSAPPKKLHSIPARPFLIARVRDSVAISSITESKIDNLLGSVKDQEGPVVQQLKKHSDNSVKIFFRNEQNRDKARQLLDKPEEEKVFQNVHAPQNCYPAILRLNGVNGLGRIREDGVISNIDLFNARTKQKCGLINKLQTENPVLKGKIAGVRILFNREDFSLVRLSLHFKTTRDHYLELGRIQLGNKAHTVVEVDVNKEVRFCTRCQGYGHLSKFCSKPITCGNCTHNLDSEMQDDIDENALFCGTPSVEGQKEM
ncbi:hypothetical protein DAPPUDRAFT_223019 [Daphnia pulex]|uniref:Uncharacterized protein n=1 Tax=Daphnia pulex TaxID=6669 RepID=E9G7W3_DAPPU|nr:hypothetical protein DAPPUDRAFT_223019 [Daphnia pulex]|eukprot:EFX84592.1 hypothetical protein DAPPUDRAFT_223019 [Daphnia pulex]